MTASYSITELFFTSQGEGFHAGKEAIFCRFSRCNLWSGREEDRSSAVCRFCDTDFNHTEGEGGGIFSSAELASHAEQLWQRHHRNKQQKPFIVCTGGEPLLQLDEELISALHDKNFFIAVETNGTIKAPDDIDWLTVSPKAGAHIRQWKGDEMKIILPQEGWQMKQLEKIRQKGTFNHYFIQPKDDPQQLRHLANIMAYCITHPTWRISLQLHKLWNIP